MIIPLKEQNAEIAHPVDNATPERLELVHYDDGLLGVAGPIMIIAYALVFVIATVTFAGTTLSLYVVAVSAVFAIFFFAIPLTMMRIRSRRDDRWRRDRALSKGAEVDICTGSMRRWEAVVQIVAIPLAILAAFTTLAINWTSQ